MSGAKLRELERRRRETGAVVDEAARLRERVRVGDLSAERLQLAAWCGHSAAGRASGASPAPPPRDQDELWSWVEGITLSAPLAMSHPLLSTGQMIHRSSASRLPQGAARALCVAVSTQVAEHALRAGRAPGAPVHHRSCA